MKIVRSIRTHVLPNSKAIQRAKEWCGDFVLDVDADFDCSSGRGPSFEIRLLREFCGTISPFWTESR